jgi:endonuclease/exonuclease/phosphatase family metal-dependent hydrolase
VDEIFKADSNSKIVIMGDFNDETDNISISKTLSAQPLGSSFQSATLYNCFSILDAQGKGTYNFRGNWNMLDQIILSGPLLKPSKGLYFSRYEIFQQEWMMYEDKTYGRTPNRTYGGQRYFGGVSDHLPVVIRQ